MIGRTEYERLSLKTSSGDPVKVHFSPRLGSLTATTNGHESAVDLLVWPVKNAFSTDKLVLVTEHYIDDFDLSTDTFALPPEWANALIWRLAWELGFEYGLEEKQLAALKAVADEKKFTLLYQYDVENAPVRFAMDML
jgi:hypothetical protein